MVQIDLEMPKECQECVFHVREKDNDYGWFCDCMLTDTNINLLHHKKPSDCPLEEVSSGQWISHHIGAYYECSNCHEKHNSKYTKYCPSCGAKMGSEET